MTVARLRTSLAVLSLAALAASAFSVPLRAQAIDGARAGAAAVPTAHVFAARPGRPLDTLPRHRAATRDARMAARVVTAVLGGAIGIALALETDISGAYVAGGVGVATFAAAPAFREDGRWCRSYGDRLGRAYIGTLLGSIGGMAGMAIAAREGAGYGSLVAVPIGQVVGASIMTARCERPARR